MSLVVSNEQLNEFGVESVQEAVAESGQPQCLERVEGESKERASFG
jgi:hypothetical protein